MPHFAPALNHGNADSQDGFLAPATSRSLKRYGLIMDAPKTPLDQIFNAFDEAYASANVFTPPRPLEPIARPTSAFSDSGDSTTSSDSSPSFEEGGTSPDSEYPDAFAFPSSHNTTLSSPMEFQSSNRKSRRLSSYDKIKWTADMDEHLWQTYTSYLADPTVTPFKMLPGTAPPLGVCHRVARDAKKNWKAPRVPLSPIVEDRESPYMSLDAALSRGSSSKADDGSMMYRAQPSLGNDRRNPGKWPRSEASTRRRLRELCKRKPALSPHYQRLMSPRTAPPNDSAAGTNPDGGLSRSTSPPEQTTSDSAFSTRDMNISLATSLAASMQPDGPLSQLTGEAMKRRPYSTDWNPRGRRSAVAHHKSKSLHLSLGIGVTGHQLNSFRKLASPFGDITGPMNKLPGLPENEEIPPIDLVHPTQKPFHGTRPLSASMKRRAEHPLGDETASETDNRRSLLDGLFDQRTTQGHRRVRSRGFSIGTVPFSNPRYSSSNVSNHLSGLFTNPPNFERHSMSSELDAWGSFSREFDTANAHVLELEGARLHAPPMADHIRRLGSPFVPIPDQPLSRTFPRTAFPNGLDSLAAVGQQQKQGNQFE